MYEQAVAVDDVILGVQVYHGVVAGKDCAEAVVIGLVVEGAQDRLVNVETLFYDFDVAVDGDVWLLGLRSLGLQGRDCRR